MTGTEAPALSGRHAFSHRRENARLSALHRGDFWLPARAPRCSGFPPVSCGDLIRRIGSYCPEDRVLGPPQARLQPQPHPPDSHGWLALRDRLAKAPLMSRAETHIELTGGPFRRPRPDTGDFINAIDPNRTHIRRAADPPISPV